MANRLSEVARAYFIRKLSESVPSTTPLNAIKRRYWIKFVGGFTATTPFQEMERAWISKVLSDAGLTETEWGDTWKAMVVSIGKTPSPRSQENQLIFYLNAP